MDRSIYRNLQLACLADMTKYVRSPQESVKISEMYHSVPRQLAKENPKFKYKDVHKGMGRREFAGPPDWLNAAGMVYSVKNVDAPLQPLKGYADEKDFKVYLSVTGMLMNLCGMHYRDTLPGTDNVCKGAVIENYVFQQMKLKHPDLYYFHPGAGIVVLPV